MTIQDQFLLPIMIHQLRHCPKEKMLFIISVDEKYIKAMSGDVSHQLRHCLREKILFITSIDQKSIIIIGMFVLSTNLTHTIRFYADVSIAKFCWWCKSPCQPQCALKLSIFSFC